MDSHKDGTKSAGLGPRGPKMQTIVEVIRCKTAKQGRPTEDVGSPHCIHPSKGWTPVHFAAYHNREAALSHFLQARRPLDEGAGSVETPLLVAVAAGHVNIVSALASGGANVNATTQEEGETALHVAIKSGRADIFNVILAHNPEINARTAHSLKTPLHYAVVRTDSLTFIKTLLQHGASYDLLDSNHCTAAETAITQKNINAAIAIVNAAGGDSKKLAKEKKMLLDHVDQRKNRATMTTEQITTVFEAACPRNSTTLIEAIKRDDIGLAETFLNKDADPNRSSPSGLRPIFAALRSTGANWTQMVQLLVKHNVDATVKDNDGLTVLQTALERVSAHNRDEIQTLFEDLISRNADPRVLYLDGQTLLHRAVSFPVSNAKLALRLIECGVDVNAVDKTGSAALHFASTRPCMEVLLKNGANAALTNKAGLTPFRSALTNALKETEPDLEPLVKVSDIRLVHETGRTALHIAAEKGLVRTVRLLLKYGADPATVNSERRTALIVAAIAQQWTVVPLLANQPVVNNWDAKGLTALHHIVKSIPRPPSTWEDIASVAVKFCSERSISRTLRNTTGETPLITAVLNLPEEGLPVIEALLGENGAERASGRNNCVGHEDHKQCSALYHAVTLEKPSFVLALLKSGAPFVLSDWVWAKEYSDTQKHKVTLKFFAEHEWIRRVRHMVRGTGYTAPDSDSPNDFPMAELEELLALGLDPNSLPAPKPHLRTSLLWVILNQTLAQPELPLQYIHAALDLLFRFNVDANAVTTPKSSIPVQELEPQTPTRHPLTFLLEEHPSIDIAVITLLLEKDMNMGIASPIYQGRYPFHSAVKANRMDIVKAFLKHGANVNPLDDKKQTPLFIAAENGLSDIADLLLKSGASVNIRNVERRTSLHLATAKGSEEIVTRLLKAGAKPLEANKPVNRPEVSPETMRQRAASMEQLTGGRPREDHDMEKQKRADHQAFLRQREQLRKEREFEARQASQAQQMASQPNLRAVSDNHVGQRRQSPLPLNKSRSDMKLNGRGFSSTQQLGQIGSTTSLAQRPSNDSAVPSQRPSNTQPLGQISSTTTLAQRPSNDSGVPSQRPSHSSSNASTPQPPSDSSRAPSKQSSYFPKTLPKQQPSSVTTAAPAAVSKAAAVVPKATPKMATASQPNLLNTLPTLPATTTPVSPLSPPLATPISQAETMRPDAVSPAPSKSPFSKKPNFASSLASRFSRARTPKLTSSQSTISLNTKPSKSFLANTFRTIQPLFMNTNATSPMSSSATLDSSDMNLLNSTLHGIGQPALTNTGRTPPPPPHKYTTSGTSNLSAGEKPLSKPRIDSGVIETGGKPLPALDNSKATFDINFDEEKPPSRGRKPARTDEELSDWLKISRMMDGL